MRLQPISMTNTAVFCVTTPKVSTGLSGESDTSTTKRQALLKISNASSIFSGNTSAACATRAWRATPQGRECRQQGAGQPANEAGGHALERGAEHPHLQGVDKIRQVRSSVGSNGRNLCRKRQSGEPGSLETPCLAIRDAHPTAQMNVQTDAERLSPVQGGKTRKLVFKEFPEPLRRRATVTGCVHDAFLLGQWAVQSVTSLPDRSGSESGKRRQRISRWRRCAHTSLAQHRRCSYDAMTISGSGHLPFSMHGTNRKPNLLHRGFRIEPVERYAHGCRQSFIGAIDRRPVGVESCDRGILKRLKNRSRDFQQLVTNGDFLLLAEGSRHHYGIHGLGVGPSSRVRSRRSRAVRMSCTHAASVSYAPRTEKYSSRPWTSAIASALEDLRVAGGDREISAFPKLAPRHSIRRPRRRS